MNHIKAKIATIEACDNLHILTSYSGDTLLTMIGLELQKGVHIGSDITLSVKPTQIAIGKDIRGILSCENQLPVTIHSIQEGILLTILKLQFFDTMLESIITTATCKKMSLKKGDSLTAIFKASDLFIVEVADA